MKNRSDIILIEDNPHDEELTLHSLKKLLVNNQDVVVLRDGQEALDYLIGSDEISRKSKSRPRVVFLDLKLPKVDGFEILQKIRTDDDLCFVPVVILSSSNHENDIVRAYQLGANSYVVKPVEFGKLQETIALIGKYWGQINQLPE